MPIKQKLFSFSIYVLAAFSLWLVKYLFRKNEHSNLILSMYGFMVLGAISALRSDTVGVDTIQYAAIYPKIGNATFPFSGFRYEIGFSTFCKICYAITPNPQFLIIVSSLFIQFCFIFFIYKNSKDVLFSLIAYIFSMCFFFNMSAMRQAMAFGIVLLFVHFLKQNKTYWLFFFGIALGCLFHKVALACVLFAFYPFLKNGRVFLAFCFYAALIFLAVGEKPLFYLISKTSYNIYLTSQFNKSALLGGLFNLCPTILLGLIYWIHLTDFLYFKKMPLFSSSNRVLSPRGAKYQVQRIFNNLNFSLLFPLSLGEGLFFSMLTIKYIFLNRFFFIFLTIPVLLMPTYMENEKRQKTTKIFILCFLFLSFACVHFLRPEWYGTSNYSLFFQTTM